MTNNKRLTQKYLNSTGESIIYQKHKKVINERTPFSIWSQLEYDYKALSKLPDQVL